MGISVVRSSAFKWFLLKQGWSSERNMKVVLLFCVLVVYSVASPDNEWTRHKAQYGHSFKSSVAEAEAQKRFETKMKKFAEHNKKFAAGKVSYKLGPNKYTHLSPEEFKRTMLGLTVDKNPPLRKSVSQYIHPAITYLRTAYNNYTFPSICDWRYAGAVTSVKDQYPCACCYSFSAVGAIEGAMVAQKRLKVTSLSNQQIIDCSYGPYNWGCNGGFMTVAFQSVIQTGGISLNEYYPFVAKLGKCQPVGPQTMALSDYVEIPAGDEELMKRALVAFGPLAVAFDASDPFVNYQTGVYHNDNCNNTDMLHAVLLIGYGTENGKDYWLLKNSWGTSYGEQGFFKLERGTNHCGIANMVSFPLAK